MAMAFQAPTHSQSPCLIDTFHAVHTIVAFHTTDAAVDVGTMVEINKIGQIMDTHPGNRLAGGVTFSHQCQFGTVRRDPIMAVHANFRGRDCRMSCFFHGGMTVATIQSQFACMEGVGERDGLRRGVADVDRLRIGSKPRDAQEIKRHKQKDRSKEGASTIEPQW